MEKRNIVRIDAGRLYVGLRTPMAEINITTLLKKEKGVKRGPYWHDIEKTLPLVCVIVAAHKSDRRYYYSRCTKFVCWDSWCVRIILAIFQK